jgi:phage-related protein
LNTSFTIYKAGSYTAPTALGTLSGTITAGQLSTFSVDLTGYSSDNTLSDFTAHISPTSMPSLGTFVCNCTVKTYINGVLTIDSMVMDLTSTQILTVLVRSGTGSGLLSQTLTKNVTVELPPKRSITHSGTLSADVPGTIVFTISPTPISNANIRVYYDTISTSSAPQQCGTGTSTGNTATTTCTIPAGVYYLYISLDIDLYKISNYSTSGLVYLGIKILLQTNPTGKVYSDTSGTTLATIGSNVRMWKDLAGGSYNFISNPSAPYPTYAQIGGVNAIYFGNGYLSTVNAFLNQNMSSFTFEIFIYPTAREQITLFVRQHDGFDTYDWMYIGTNGNLGYQSSNSSKTPDLGITINLNSWTHIVITGTGIYINGSKVLTRIFSYSGSTVNDNRVMIGWGGTRFYLTEYNVYSSNMSDAKVTSSYTDIRTKYGV